MAAGKSVRLRTEVKRKAVAASRQTAIVRSRWPPCGRPSRPWIRMKREAEKRPASHRFWDPTHDDEAVMDGAPGDWVRARRRKLRRAARGGEKSRKRQARAPMREMCNAA